MSRNNPNNPVYIYIYIYIGVDPDLDERNIQAKPWNTSVNNPNSPNNSNNPNSPIIITLG